MTSPFTVNHGEKPGSEADEPEKIVLLPATAIPLDTPVRGGPLMVVNAKVLEDGKVHLTLIKDDEDQTSFS